MINTKEKQKRLAEELADEKLWGKKRSVCCNAPMQEENNQCIACGADGSHFVTDEEVEQLVDEKLRQEANEIDLKI